MRVFENTRNIVVEGDVFEGLEAAVSDGTVNLIFADPPLQYRKSI